MLIQSTEHIQLHDLSHCHRAAFPQSLATALGQHYVTCMLSWYLSSSKTFLFHVQDDKGHIVGYCGGMISDGTLPTGSASGMAQHSFYAALWAFVTHPWVLWHPEVRAKWPLLKKNLLFRMGLSKKRDITTEQAQKMSFEPQVGLVVIGVDPACHGMGYGSFLLQEFERKAFINYGIHLLQLTVLANNVKAIRAYERNGWIRGKQQGKSLLMTKEVPQ
jgi:ribosomal protein S18 acetylase RimI-like enzyme